MNKTYYSYGNDDLWIFCGRELLDKTIITNLNEDVSQHDTILDNPNIYVTFFMYVNHSNVQFIANLIMHYGVEQCIFIHDNELFPREIFDNFMHNYDMKMMTFEKDNREYEIIRYVLK